MTIDEIITIILDEAFYVHREIGPGMLENVYQKCLGYRVQKRGLLVESEVPIPVIFDEVKLDCGYRSDHVVERSVIVEIKTVNY